MSTEAKRPAGWESAELDSLAEINPRRARQELDAATSVVFVPMAAVVEGFGGIDTSLERPFGEVQSGYTQFTGGDVLLAKITPCMENGKLAIVPELKSGYGYGSTEFHVIRPPNVIIGRWIAHYLSQETVRRDARAHMTGTAGQLRVPDRWLRALNIPIAPMAEQLRSLEKVDELFSRLEASVAALKRVQTSLKRYRASVLRAAVEGKLTEAWRAEHPATETGAELVQRILKERRVAWEKAELQRYAKAGKVPPKGRQDNYREHPGPDAVGLRELPDRWTWTTLQQISSIGTGATPLKANPRYYGGGTVPWVTSAVVNEPYVDEPSGFVTETALLETNLTLYNPGTLLVAMYGEGKTRGKCAELRISSTTNQALAAVDISHAPTTVRSFVKSVLQSNYEALRNLSSGGVQPNLNLGHIRASLVPFPPLEEQAEIVVEADRRLTLAAAVEASVDVSLKRAERLRQSILKRAFEGRLVSQGPKEDPASAILDWIGRAPIRAVAERRSAYHVAHLDAGTASCDPSKAIAGQLDLFRDESPASAPDGVERGQ